MPRGCCQLPILRVRRRENCCVLPAKECVSLSPRFVSRPARAPPPELDVNVGQLAVEEAPGLSRRTHGRTDRGITASSELATPGASFGPNRVPNHHPDLPLPSLVSGLSLRARAAPAGAPRVDQYPRAVGPAPHAAVAVQSAYFSRHHVSIRARSKGSRW